MFVTFRRGEIMLPTNAHLCSLGKDSLWSSPVILSCHVHANVVRIYNAESDLVGLGWGPKFCIYNKLLGNADITGLQTTFSSKG